MLKAIVYKSLGHKMFCELPHAPSALAAILGVSQPMISLIRAGKRRTNDEVRAKCVGLGIPLAAWITPPRSAPAPVPPASRQAGEHRTLPTLSDIPAGEATRQTLRRTDWIDGVPPPPRRDLPALEEPARPPAPPPPPVHDLPPAPEERGIADVQWAIDALRAELAAEVDPTRRERLIAKIHAAGAAFAKLQQQQPLEEKEPEVDWAALPYPLYALHEAHTRLQSWLRDHPGQVPPEAPRHPARLCVVDPARGARLGVLDAEGWVVLVAPTPIEVSALAALVRSGWARPVRPRGLYEHEPAGEVDARPVC